MLTRENLKAFRDCLSYEDDVNCKDCINNLNGGPCFTKTQDVIDSHLSALDEIDRLTAELAAKDKEVQHYMGVASIIAKEQGLIGNFPTGQIKPIGRNIFDSAKVVQSEVRTEIKVDRTKPLVQDTGNLLIPKREEETAK